MPNEQIEQRQPKKEVKKPGAWSVLKDKFGLGNRWEQEVAYLESLEGVAPTPETSAEAEAKVKKIEQDIDTEIRAGVAALQTELASANEEITELDIDDLILVEELQQVDEEVLTLADLEEVVSDEEVLTLEDLEEVEDHEPSATPETSEEPTDDTTEVEQTPAAVEQPATLVHPNDIEAVPVKAKQQEEPTAEPAPVVVVEQPTIAEPTTVEVTPTEVIEPAPAVVESEPPSASEEEISVAAEEAPDEATTEVTENEAAKPTETVAEQQETESVKEAIERLTENFVSALDTFDRRERITDNEYFQFLQGLPNFIETLEFELPRDTRFPADEIKSLSLMITDALTTSSVRFDASVDAMLQSLRSPEATSATEKLDHLAQFQQTEQETILSTDLFPRIDELMDTLDRVGSKIGKLFELTHDPADQDRSFQVFNFRNTVNTVKSVLQEQQRVYANSSQSVENDLAQALSEEYEVPQAA